MAFRHPDDLRPLPESLETLGRAILDAAFEVHSELGPGLLESLYHRGLVEELRRRQLQAASHVRVPVLYKGAPLGAPLELDLLVENSVIVEVKSVLELHPVYEAQLRSYLRLTGRQLGYVLNFNETYLRRGITRVVWTRA